MKVYVAGKFGAKPAAREAMEAVRARGHSVTYDWTNHTDIALKRSADDYANEALHDLQGSIELVRV